MGSDLVVEQPVYEWDWCILGYFIYDEHRALNRTRNEAHALWRTLRDDPYAEVWMLRNAKAVAGFVALHVGHKESDHHTASLRIHLAESVRGAGLGERLVRTALAWADEAGITRVTATPYLDGRDKLGFFVRLGFVIEGTARGAVKVNGELVDTALLARA